MGGFGWHGANTPCPLMKIDNRKEEEVEEVEEVVCREEDQLAGMEILTHVSTMSAFSAVR